MKKKTFYQTSILLYFLLGLFLFFLIADIYAIVSLLLYEKNTYEYICLIVSICILPFVVYTILRFARNRIIFKEECIFVPENWGGNDMKYQYETIINYAEIKNIYIVTSDNNSLNKPIKYSFLPMPYLVFDCINGEQEAINLFYYSKKTTIKIINEAIERAAKFNNILSIESGDKILNDFLHNEKINK